MRRTMIYAGGFVLLAGLALMTLPDAARRIEALLQDEIDYTLADKGLSGIEAEVDGQTIRLTYGDTATDTLKDQQAGTAAARMAWAADAAKALRGGLYPASGHGGRIWGPATRVQVDDAAVGRMEQQLRDQAARKTLHNEIRREAESCTDQVTAAVAQRKLSFISGSFDLTPDSDVMLDDIYRVIAACPGRLVLHVEGHTDDTGTEADNLTLSSHRAEAAAQGLVRRGLSPDRVRSAGFGESRPIADNTTPEGQKTNRRVTFVMAPPEADMP